MTTRRWLAGVLTGLLAWSALLGGAVAWGQEPLTLTLATNHVDFAAGDRLQVAVGVENTGLPGTTADFLVGVVLPDGSTVVAFGPGGGPGVGTLGDLATLPAFAPAVSLASPFALAPQPVLEYQWTGTEPLGQYLLFTAAVRSGGLADGSLGPVDLLALATRTLRLEAGAGGAADWRAFADSRTVDPAPDARALLQARAPTACGPDPAGETLALPAALGRLVAAVEELAGPQPLASFVAGLGELSRAPTIAAAALVDQKPHAALAALLAATMREPQEPAHLINAAGLASLLGFPSEALSLLAAADPLGVDTYSPLGIPGRALAQNNRGHALLSLGRWAEAQVALEEAVALAPHLAEARTNLGLALLCQANEDRAARLFRAGRWRTLGLPVPAEIAPPEAPPPGPDTVVTIQATRPTATEAPPTGGLLTVRRTGDPALALTVAYEVSGSATPDADYAALPGTVTIPAGAFAVDIPVLPHRDDADDPDETVVVTLAPAAGYAVGPADSATVTIGDFLLPAGRVRRAMLPGPLDSVLQIPQIFDLSAGVEGHLPTLPYPETPEQTSTLQAVYQALDDQRRQRWEERSARLGEIIQAITAGPTPSLLTSTRISDVLIAMHTYASEPALHPLVVEVEAADAEVRGIHYTIQTTLTHNAEPYHAAVAACLYQPGFDACVHQATNQYYCEPIRTAHPRWRTAMARLDGAVHALFGPWSTYVTALAANIADPLHHEKALLQGGESHADFLLYVRLMGPAQSYSHTVDRHFRRSGKYGCRTTEPPPPDDAIGPPALTDLGNCPPALTSAKVQLKFVEVLSVAFNCETVEIEVAEPGLGFFGQIGFTARPGQAVQATLFVGAKASLPLSGLSAKEGFFLRTDGQQLTDVGFKVSASNLLGAPAGGLKVDAPFNMEFGLAAAVQYWGPRY